MKYQSIISYFLWYVRLCIFEYINVFSVGKKFVVKRVYSGNIMTSLNMRGFHICILRLSSHVDWIKLLDQSTTAPGWPAPHIMNDEMEDGREFTEVSDDPVLKVRSTYVNKGIFIFFRTKDYWKNNKCVPTNDFS